MADKPLPGKGLMGWFGRQVGHVKKAVKTDPGKVKKAVPSPPPKPSATSADPAAAPIDKDNSAPKIIYRDNKIEEAPHPTEPGLKLRRTIIDEVIADDPPTPPR